MWRWGWRGGSGECIMSIMGPHKDCRTNICVCVCSRLLDLNTVFMTGFVKTEQRHGHNLPLPLSTLSHYLSIPPHSSLSPRKSISRSLHSKVHYSLLPAAFSVCYLSHSHYLCLSLWLSSLFITLVKSDLMFFLHYFTLGFSSPSIRLPAHVELPPLTVQPLFLPTYFCPLADHLCRSTAFPDISNTLYFFHCSPLLLSSSLLSSPSLSLTLLPGAACTLSLLAAPT